MAYYDDQDEELQGQQGQAPSQGPQTTGESGIISGQGAQPGAGTPAQTPDNPGNFVGISQYLEANKLQSSKLGDQVAGQVQSTISKANEDVGALQGKFETLANQGQIENIGTAGQEASDITNRAAQGQSGSVKDQDTQRFSQIANAQYQGPNSLIETEYYQPALQNLQQAQKYADLSKKESGSQQLLRDVYNKPGYSQGENRLDAYLLNSQDNRAKLAEARKDAKDLQGDFDAANQNSEAYAQAQKNLAASTAQAARQGLTTAQTQRNKQVADRLSSEESQWADEYNKYVNLLANSAEGTNLKLTPEEARKLGVEQGQKIYNLLNTQAQGASNAQELAKRYLDLQAYDPNRVISKDEQAQLAALDQLSGTFGGQLQNKYTQAELAGTMQRATNFAADKFGLNAKQRQQVFDAVDKIRNFSTESTGGANIWDKTPTYKVVNHVREQIVTNLPWPLSDIVEWVTRPVEQVLGGVDIQVGHVDANAKTEGQLGQYLQGGAGAAQTTTSGTKSLDLGTFMSPDYLISDRADNKIKEIQNNLTAQNQANWAKQIEDYLKQIGYYNQVK